MMQIKFAGEIGRRFGTTHQFAVKTPNEAIRSLCQLVPGFRTFLTSAHERGIFFQIVTSNQEDGITYDELGLGCQSFTLVPIITGSFFGLFGGKGGGIFSILAGIALVAFAMTGFGVVTFGAIGTISAGVQTATMALGMGLLFTGVSSLFAPGAPTGQKNITEGRDANDAIAAGAAPVAANGQPVPLLFGEYLVSRMPVIASYIKDNEGFFLGLVSEGVIEGFPSGGADDNLYLDGLIAKASVLENVELTDGTQTAKEIDNVKSAGFSISVNAPFNPQGGDYDDSDDFSVGNTQVVRTFTQQEADTLRVRLSIGPCYQSKTKSDSDGSEQGYREYEDSESGESGDNPTHIVIRLFSGGSDVPFDQEDIIVQKQTSTKLKEVVFSVEDQPTPISIEVTRVDRRGPKPPVVKTSDSKSKQYSWVKSGVTWVSADVTWAEELVYPFSSLLGLKFKAGEFSRFPQVQARLKGLNVPTLNKALVVTYSFSKNPAYVLLGLLTDPRYGAGHRVYNIDGKEHIQAGIRIEDIDLASFYKAAKYCNANKIKFNGYINRDSDALELFRGIASTFQAQIIYAGGFITLVVDDEVTDPGDIRIYSAANTIGSVEGDSAAPHFTYEGSARRARSTAVEVSYIEPSEFYKESKVLIEDAGMIDRYGYNLANIRALGCTSAEQARRMGRYTLATNVKSTDTVSFRVGPDGAMLIPGDVCLILDPLKTGMVCGGRITGVTNTSITTDRELSNISYSGNYQLYVYGASGVAIKRTVNSVSTSGTINLTGSGWGGNRPSTMDMWGLVKEVSGSQHKKEPMYRVQSVKEEGDGTYTVIGIKYDKTKFSYVDSGGSLASSVSYGSKTSSSSRRLTMSAKSISFSLRTPD